MGHGQAKIAVVIQAQALVGWVAAVKDMALKAEALKGNAVSSVGGRVVHQAVWYVRFGEHTPKPKDKTPLRRGMVLRRTKAETQVLRFICGQLFFFFFLIEDWLNTMNSLQRAVDHPFCIGPVEC